MSVDYATLCPSCNGQIQAHQEHECPVMAREQAVHEAVHAARKRALEAAVSGEGTPPEPGQAPPESAGPHVLSGMTNQTLRPDVGKES